MEEKIYTTSEVAEYLGISSKKVRALLQPITKDGQPLRKGREYVYRSGEVEELRKRLEEKRKEMGFLRPEDLPEEHREELHSDAVSYEFLNTLAALLAGTRRTKEPPLSEEYRTRLQSVLERYGATGYGPDEVIKSVLLVARKEKTVDERALTDFPEDWLLSVDEEIIQKRVNPKKWESKVPLALSRFFSEIADKFDRYRSQLPLTMTEEEARQAVSDFVKELDTPLSKEMLFDFLMKYGKGEISREYFGEEARKVAQRYIKTEETTPTLKVTLRREFKREIQKAARVVVEEISELMEEHDII
jgi:hypothetical protein